MDIISTNIMYTCTVLNKPVMTKVEEKDVSTAENSDGGHGVHIDVQCECGYGHTLCLKE